MLEVTETPSHPPTPARIIKAVIANSRTLAVQSHNYGNGSLNSVCSDPSVLDGNLSSS
jgi:hypothetical protein